MFIFFLFFASLNMMRFRVLPAFKTAIKSVKTQVDDVVSWNEKFIFMWSWRPTHFKYKNSFFPDDVIQRAKANSLDSIVDWQMATSAFESNKLTETGNNLSMLRMSVNKNTKKNQVEAVNLGSHRMLLVDSSVNAKTSKVIDGELYLSHTSPNIVFDAPEDLIVIIANIEFWNHVTDKKAVEICSKNSQNLENLSDQLVFSACESAMEQCEFVKNLHPMGKVFSGISANERFTVTIVKLEKGESRVRSSSLTRKLKYK